jgi:hypothetical protein
MNTSAQIWYLFRRWAEICRAFLSDKGRQTQSIISLISKMDKNQMSLLVTCITPKSKIII